MEIDWPITGSADRRYEPGRRTRSAVYVAALVGLLLVAGCGGDGTTKTPAGTASASPPGSVVARTPSMGALALEVPDITIVAYQGADALGGEEVALSEIVGRGRPVVLNFWAALCPPCRAEMPDIQRVYEAHRDEVTIVGVDIGPQQFLGTREEGQGLLEELDISYPAGTTYDENVVRGFRIVGMPTTFFIRADGSLLRAWSGLLNESKINEIIAELVES
jgi:thiol-disulfide isomerase/thioredoxin